MIKILPVSEIQRNLKKNILELKNQKVKTIVSNNKTIAFLLSLEEYKKLIKKNKLPWDIPYDWEIRGFKRFEQKEQKGASEFQDADIIVKKLINNK